MIRILGTKRVLTLVILVALNAAFAVGVYMYLGPESVKKNNELMGMRGQIATVVGDIERMQLEFDQLEDQQAAFDVLKEDDFLKPMNRRQAELLIEKITKEVGVKSAVASIQRGHIEQNDEAQKAAYRVLVSEVKIYIKAVEDIDVYRYIYYVNKLFPGHISIDGLEISRKMDVNGAVLRSIASGNVPELVEAQVDISWRTMVPEAEAREQEEEGQL